MLFYTYFTEGKDISDLDYLTELADTAGVLTKDQVRRAPHCLMGPNDV